MFFFLFHYFQLLLMQFVYLFHVFVVNSVAKEAAKVNTVEDKIETEIQKMNQRLDRAVEQIIQSSTTYVIPFAIFSHLCSFRLFCC